jgi:NADPH:quinone reductase
MADAMKAAAHRQPGGPEILRYDDVPDPVTAPGGVLVWGEAISIEGGGFPSGLGDQEPETPLNPQTRNNRG